MFDCSKYSLILISICISLVEINVFRVSVLHDNLYVLYDVGFPGPVGATGAPGGRGTPGGPG